MARATRTRWPERRPVGDASDPRGFEQLLERYVEWLAVHHFSEGMQISARRLVRTFAVWCEERGIVRPLEVTRDVLERYQRHVYYLKRDNGRGLGFKTQLARLSQVRGFFRWLARERYLLVNPASELVLPRKPPRLPTDGFSAAEVEQILRAIDVETPLGLRDRALVETLYSTGIRRTELVKLDLYALDLERRWVTVREGKWSRDRVVPIGERAALWVERYLAEVRPGLVLHADEWAVFLSATGVRFDPASLTNHVSRLIKSSGVRPRVGACHLFRHTMATLMLEGGADIRFIQEMLGHRSLETTEIYTKVSITKLQQIHAATHPARMERTSTVAEELAGELEEEDATRS